MSKIRLTVELDDSSPYDLEIIKLLSASPEGERKNIITSAILYWSRNPAFMLTDKIDQLLQLLKTMGYEITGKSPVKPKAVKQRSNDHSPIVLPKASIEAKPELVTADLNMAVEDEAGDAFSQLMKSMETGN